MPKMDRMEPYIRCTDGVGPGPWQRHKVQEENDGGKDPAQVLDPGKVQWMSSYSVFEPWRSMLDTSVDGTSCVVLTWGFMRKSLYWTNQDVSNHMWIPLTLWFLATDGSDSCSNWLRSSH